MFYKQKSTKIDVFRKFNFGQKTYCTSDVNLSHFCHHNVLGNGTTGRARILGEKWR